MEDAALVRCGESRADLPRDFEPAVFGKPPDALQQRRKVFAVDVLHREKRRAVDFIDVVDAADVGMRDLARHPDFGVELRQARRILVDVRREELQRDRLTELQVVGAVDLAHAAATEAFDDPVASAEEGARLEAAVIDRARRREPAASRTEDENPLTNESGGRPRPSSSSRPFRSRAPGG